MISDREWRLRERIDQLTDERNYWRAQYDRRTPLLERWMKRHRWMKMSRDGWRLRYQYAQAEIRRLRAQKVARAA